MPMVEGIGDEVLQVFGICIIILIFVTAWKSTAIRELPQIRAVFILDRRSQTVFTNDLSSPPAPAAPPDAGQQNDSINNASTNSSSNPMVGTESPSDNQDCKPSSSHNEVNALRLSYFSNLQNQSHAPSTSSALSSEESSQPQPPSDVPNECEVEGTVDGEESEHSIRIKLKYLNDDQRIVRGNLKELLGVFKRRYFETELSNNKNVLLIFQGRVLREEETLENIGMYDNCVVHCLVKSVRVPEAESRQATSSNNPPADWNLGPLLLATLGAMFALAWFAYWTYPQLFGITSNILLAFLSTIFMLAVASLYYPHLFQSL